MSPFRFLPCPSCCRQCLACKDNQYPDELTLTLADLQNGPLCGDCTRANGSWVVARQGNCIATAIGGGVQSEVAYVAAFPEVPMCACAFQPASLEITLQIYWNYLGIRGRRAIQATLGNSLGCMAVTFQRVEDGQSEPFDCREFADLDIPYLSSGALCASPGATCRLAT